ncbi:MAG: DEAD/DEAH box helicase [Candidatus Nitrosopelagicus sp.]|jgi:SNF2 family DNA or RNA helicase|nr:DEAD/DEAH box helicase [Candidatus Nitrosopelagicus sp.]
MSSLSIIDDHLNLKLDTKHDNYIVTGFLCNRIGFRKQGNNFVNRKTDAITIKRIKDFFKNRKFKLNLEENCQNILQEFETGKENFENLSDEALRIKNSSDEEFDNFKVPEFLPNNILKQYQIKSVKHALKILNSANFSVPGSGKTWMTYASYFQAKADKSLPKINKLLVVCPTAAFQVWEEEYRVITGKDHEGVIHRISTNDRDQGIIPLLTKQFEILLINYEKLPDQRFLSGISQMMDDDGNNFYLVLDESHKIKSVESDRGVAAKELAPFAKRRMILTGTPMPNYHQDLWNQFNFLFPNENILGGYDAFVRKIKMKPEIETANVMERLSPFFTRINKNQLDLPKTNLIYHPCPMTKFQTEIYQTIAWDILQNSENQEKFRAYSDFEQNFMYLIMASTDPALLAQDHQYSDTLIDLEGVPIRDRIQQYGAGELSGKMIELKTLLGNIIPRNEKVVIWCNFRNTLLKVEQMIESEFHVESRRIDGSVAKDNRENKDDNKEKSIREFKTRDDMNVLIANPASLAEAVSLHKVCQQAIYVDRTYVATNWIQSKDRIHRIGSDAEATYTVLMSKYEQSDRRKTIDDMIRISLNRKEDAMNKFLKDPAPNVRITELNYDAINDPIDSEVDYKEGIEMLRENFSNDQNSQS